MLSHKILLLAYHLLFYFILVGVRSYLLYRQTGIIPFKLFKGDNAHDFNSKVVTAVFILLMFNTLIYVFCESFYHWLVPINYLHANYIWNGGWALMLISFPLIFIAQLQMHHSWRIGVDYDSKTELVTHGLFRWSRNPIYLGILLTFTGYFLVLPNALTFCLTTLIFVSIHFQVRLEEEFLDSQHGQSYLNYKSKVRRWL